MSLAAINQFLLKVFGSQNERTIKRFSPMIAAINQLESQVKSLTDVELAAQTEKLKKKLSERRDTGRSPA